MLNSCSALYHFTIMIIMMMTLIVAINMKYNLLKSISFKKRALLKNIALIGIIILMITIQFYISNHQYYLNQIGGSSGIIEYYPKIAGMENYFSVTNIKTSENIDIPEFNTTLKHMGKLNWTNHILYPEDASSYILPENEVVKWYAENTVLTDYALIWKHNGTAVDFKYKTDDDFFDNPPYSDMWQNPDYYLAHGSIGDCEDFSLAFASILEAKGISAQVVGVVLINNNNHWLVKYHHNGQTNYADINRNNVIIWHDQNPTISEELIIIDLDGIIKPN
jgi:hypothetical protein